MDSFSVFVEPILSYQRIIHLVSVLYITAHLAKYWRYSSLLFRLDGQKIVVEVHYSSLLRFQIPDSLPVLFILLTFHS